MNDRTLGWIVFIAIIVCVIVALGPKSPVVESNIPKVEVLRFQKVETLVFAQTKYGGTITAVIYEDTKTRIKYLYIWQGTGKGGPCITRLWEK